MGVPGSHSRLFRLLASFFKKNGHKQRLIKRYAEMPVLPASLYTNTNHLIIGKETARGGHKAGKSRKNPAGEPDFQ